MRVRLKGINSTRKRLSDGSVRTYWYAWKGGPALKGSPGSPEFIASYHEAVSARKTGPDGEMLSVLNKFQQSSDFDLLAPRTKQDYKKIIRAIESEFGDFPLSALTDRRTRGEFMAWRDRLAATSRRNADYHFTVLARVMSWALDRGLVPLNPCVRPGRLYRAARNDAIWTDDDEAAFLASAPAHLQLALLLALWTGQRQGDLLRLTWAAYDGKVIRLRQSKTGTRVSIPVGAPLKSALDTAKEARNAAVTILTATGGTPWTSDGFRASFRTAMRKAGVSGVTFHDTRGTAVTRLALAECSVPEIATITGHSLRDVEAILDAHYLKRDAGMARSAIEKLEKRTKTPN